jgi:hypothetical protein
MDDLCARQDAAHDRGGRVNVLILSDRGVNREERRHPVAARHVRPAPLPDPRRPAHAVSLVLETGEAREVHHFSLLIGYGCGAINPYLAFETLDDMIREGLLRTSTTRPPARTSPRPPPRASSRSCRRWASPPCRATAARRSSRRSVSAGRHRQVLHRTASRVGGIGIDRGRRGSADAPPRGLPGPPHRCRATLTSGGQYQWRSDGEFHLFNPESIHRLQKAVRTGSYETYKQYAAKVNDQREEPLHAARPARFQEAHSDPARRGRIGREHHEALQDRRDVLRLDLARKRTRRSPSR